MKNSAAPRVPSFAGHHHEIPHLLLVAAVHALKEGTKGGPAMLAAALVDVVHHIPGQQGEEGLAIPAVEGVIVAFDQGGGGEAASLMGMARICGGEARVCNESEDRDTFDFAVATGGRD